MPSPSHIVVFTGHRVDAPTRTTPRFPQSCVPAARAEILRRVRALQPTLGIAAAASGGDILFHEICAELGIPSVVRLAIAPERFVTRSVADSEGDWVDRFWKLVNVKQAEHAVAVLSDVEDQGNAPDSTVWDRANLWMLDEARSRKPDRLTLLAFWDGEKGTGPGGAADFIAQARAAGAATAVIDATRIC